MQRQGSFSQAEYAGKKKQTRRDRFLAEMEQVVPWARLVERLRPLYPKGDRGRPPIGLERMLRIYFLQQWYALADEALEDAAALPPLAGAARPDESVVRRGRGDAGGAWLVDAAGHDCRRHDHRRRALDQEQREEPRPGNAPDQEGQPWYFGLKIHVGADVDSGAAHTVTVTAANTADITEMPKLLRQGDQVIFGDAGYASDEYERGARALGLRWAVQDKSKPKGSLGAGLSSS